MPEIALVLVALAFVGLLTQLFHQNNNHKENQNCKTTPLNKSIQENKKCEPMVSQENIIHE